MEKHNKFKIDFLDRKDFDFKGIGLMSCILIDEALKRGIKAKVHLNKYVQFEYGGKKKLFYGTDNPSLPSVTRQILGSKTETKYFLKKKKISVPEGKSFDVNQLKEIISYAENINGKIVIKPDRSDFGNHVYCKVEEREIKKIVNNIAKKYENLVVEKFIEGNEYRVFITKNGCFAVTQRRPASVLGDGKSSIKELINKKNLMRQDKKKLPRILPWYRIEIDDITLNCLKKQGLTLSSIPKNNERIYLRYNSNISCGGDSISLTDSAHKSVKKIAMKVLDSIPGLKYGGVDLITKDITNDISRNYNIIEVNNMPGIILHHYPYIGPPKNVASSLIDLIFPETRSS